MNHIQFSYFNFLRKIALKWSRLVEPIWSWRDAESKGPRTKMLQLFKDNNYYYLYVFPLLPLRISGITQNTAITRYKTLPI